MDFESPGKQSDDSPGPNNGGTMWTIWRLSFYWSLPGGIHKSCKLGEGGGSATEVIKNKMNTNLKLHPLLALLIFFLKKANGMGCTSKKNILIISWNGLLICLLSHSLYLMNYLCVHYYTLQFGNVLERVRTVQSSHWYFYFVFYISVFHN